VQGMRPDNLIKDGSAAMFGGPAVTKHLADERRAFFEKARALRAVLAGLGLSRNV
jgi:hypothetical protein